MRLGVSGKIFLAYTVLLLAFAANATFTLVVIHRARQGVVANEAYLDLQGSVDAAWKSLNDFAPSLGRNLRLDPNLALGLRMTRKHLDDAVGAIDRYNEREPSSSRRRDFEVKRRQIVALKDQADALARELGAAEVASDPKARPEFDSHFATLTHNLNRMRRPLRGESGQIAQQLRDDEETSLQIALGLGGVGLLIGVVAFVIILRTLQPLRTLRARARQVAGGDYARRTGGAVARRDRRAGARVRRHGGRHPGARAAADPVGAAGDRRAHGVPDHPRGAQPAGVDRPLRRAAGRRDRRQGARAAPAAGVDRQRGRPADRDHRELPALRALSARQARTRGSGRDRGVGAGVLARRAGAGRDRA